MSRRSSRLATFTVAFFFLVTGALTAYARCLENSGNLPHHSEIGNTADAGLVSNTESLYCPDALKAYAIGQQIKFDQEKSTRIEMIADHGAAGLLLATGYPFASGLFSSLLPYRLLPVYQFNVVYRI